MPFNLEISERLREAVSATPAREALTRVRDLFPGVVVFSSSFGKEDQVIMEMIGRMGGGVRIFTLDTGRLFPETYAVWSATLERFGIPIETFVPASGPLAAFLGAHGPNAFYVTPEQRRECCGIRKVEPLQRALKGAVVWVTGLRAAQSPNREAMHPVEWDEVNGVYKFQPLLHWTDAEVDTYIREHEIPYNMLHDRGFPSIGCAPCTRATRAGEDPRAGRWWWESGDGKECGLHLRTR